jgi:hypothetical protein
MLFLTPIFHLFSPFKAGLRGSVYREGREILYSSLQNLKLHALEFQINIGYIASYIHFKEQLYV